MTQFFFFLWINIEYGFFLSVDGSMSYECKKVDYDNLIWASFWLLIHFSDLVNDIFKETIYLPITVNCFDYFWLFPIQGFGEEII